MKILLSAMFFVLLFNKAEGQKTNDSLLNVLKSEIIKKKVYDNQKEQHLIQLKAQLAMSGTDLSARYVLYDALYEAYKDYKFDSAHVYITRLLQASNLVHDVPKQYQSKIKLGLLQLSWGMYKEVFDGIAQIDVRLIPESMRSSYYGLKYRALQNLSAYNTDEFYSPATQIESMVALDSAVRLSKPGSFEKYKYTAQFLARSGHKGQAAAILKKLLRSNKITEHERAMIANDLSHLVGESEREKLITLAGIYDIRSATKQTLAAFTLGTILLKKRELDNAEFFLKEALAQAHFYGSKFHETETSIALDQVAAQKLIKVENQKNSVLTILIVVVSLALVGIAIVSVIVYNRLKKVRVREAEVQQKYQHLDNKNKRLLEDAHIKEEYIGYFFNVISGYILRLEKIKRQTERKIKLKDYDDLLLMAKEIDIKHERENLFYTFDNIFLKLFPNFIVVFNSLLKPEDQIWPKDNEILNTNLRVFALMRLGIKDSQTIANILETTISTIYTYKNRAKSKSLVQGDDFYNVIMEIQFVDLQK
jgi:hypothetical protein